MTFEDLLNSMVDHAQEKVSHRHMKKLEIMRTDEPLVCTSQYFLRLNDEYTIGFSREEMGEFRDEIVRAVNQTLAADTPPTEKVVASCLLCKAEVDEETGYSTSIGWLHFECIPG